MVCPPSSPQLPPRPPLSRGCRDLLQRLLERDPNRRISFQDFFAHPWVDLEHMPSGESLARAVSGVRAGWRADPSTPFGGEQGICPSLFVVSTVWGMGGGGRDCRSVPQTALVVQAVEKDQDGDAAAALSLYCKALDFFVPALHCECPEPLGAAGVGWPQLQWMDSRSSSPPRILWETKQRVNLALGPSEDSKEFDAGQTPHTNPCFLQMKWMPSGRRQLRPRWVRESPERSR